MPPRTLKRALCALAVLTAGAFMPLAATADVEHLTGHGGPIHALSTSDSAVLSASFDNSVGVWPRPNGGVRWLSGHTAAVKAVIALPGAQAASAGDDFSIIVWDTQTGTPLHRLSGHRGSVGGLALSPGGDQLASAGWDGRVGLWDVPTGTHTQWLNGHDGAVNAVAFIDDDTLLSASADGTIRIWDLARGGIGRPLVRHGFAINVLVSDAMAGWLAYGAVDGGTRVVSLTDETQLADLTLGRRPILAMAASPNRSRLAVGDGEGHVMVVDTEAWHIVHDNKVSARGPVWALSFVGADTLAVGGIDDSAAIIPVKGHGEPVLGLALRPFLRDPATMGNGERQFRRKCSVCHTLTGDGARRAGPTLVNIFGRRAGAVAGYNYSPTLATSDIVWSAETLDQLFDAGPDHFVPGSFMPMQRITTAQDRVDLIRYLQDHTVE